MNKKLTMSPFTTNDGTVILYRVVMPSGEVVIIQNFGEDGWNIVRTKGAKAERGTDAYKTAEEALKALEAEVNAAVIAGHRN